MNTRTALRLLGSSTRLDVIQGVLKQLPNGVNTLNEEVSPKALNTSASTKTNTSINDAFK